MVFVPVLYVWHVCDWYVVLCVCSMHGEYVCVSVCGLNGVCVIVSGMFAVWYVWSMCVVCVCGV